MIGVLRVLHDDFSDAPYGLDTLWQKTPKQLEIVIHTLPYIKLDICSLAFRSLHKRVDAVVQDFGITGLNVQGW